MAVQDYPALTKPYNLEDDYLDYDSDFGDSKPPVASFSAADPYAGELDTAS